MTRYIKWDQYPDGNHQLSEEEAGDKYGISLRVFRDRLSKRSRRNGWTYTAYRKRGVLHFSIQR